MVVEVESRDRYQIQSLTNQLLQLATTGVLPSRSAFGYRCRVATYVTRYRVSCALTGHSANP
jgi:hypothetical protein